MSFGDPHNPYGQQPPQGQPGYGYPQQAPQGIPPQGGYAYPQQAPQAYPGGPVGYPGGPAVEMPGGVKAARVILFVLGGLQTLGAVIWLVGGVLFAAIFSSETNSSTTEDELAVAGIFVVLGALLSVAFALWAILTGAKLGKGRGGVRASGIIYGSLVTLVGVLSLVSNVIAVGAASTSEHTPAGVVVLSLVMAAIPLGLGLGILVGLAKSNASAYFKRPRY
ncbi:hypothetical protein AB0B78_13745 [Streptomyces sp. NPDC040724]|uniref:hypothetical protein n=1 Tax=unclassified Streptomyces TaxID=2593676 RepID=UPI0033DA5EF5